MYHTANRQKTRWHGLQEGFSLVLTFCSGQRTCGKGWEGPSSSVGACPWHEHVVFSVRKITRGVWYFLLSPVSHPVCILFGYNAIHAIEATGYRAGFKGTAALQSSGLAPFLLSPLQGARYDNFIPLLAHKRRRDSNLSFKNVLWLNLL